MTHWKNLANYDYLGAYSLENIADEITVTIKDVKAELVTAPGGKKEECIVAYFEEKNVSGVAIKPMVLNKTNCKIISKLLNTPFIEKWKGQKVIIYSTTTKFQRDIVSCLRIKETLPPKVEYYCEECGTLVEESFAKKVMNKYGVVLCSETCLEKYKNKDKIEEEKGE